MRADLPYRPFQLRFGLFVILAIAIAAAGCKTKKDPDAPTVIGVPPSTAYLGVEYYYNFGAYGGDGILDYSLTNAPSWLALEDTSNKARQGIILRGVPGLTGGQRGEEDLGRTRNINLLTTDGQRVGLQPFEIEVQQNPLSMEADLVTEGEASPVPEVVDDQCEPPPLGEKGEHTYTINLYDGDGDFVGTEQRTSETQPVLVKVLLEQPSVTRVQVAFELGTDYDPNSCKPKSLSPPHQNCEHSTQNSGDAIISRDVIALGSNSVDRLPVPDYLQYQTDDEGNYTRGVITLEPGITECYVRLEVVNDTVPEPSERFELRLTEVRGGLAGLGSDNGGVEQGVSIVDNEPVVTLETLSGGTRDVINADEVREYAARLTGERDGEVRAKLGTGEGSSAQLGPDFELEVPDGDGGWLTGDLLTFPDGQDEVRFRVRIAGDYSNTGNNDKVIVLGLNVAFQNGREGFARSGEGNLRININELLDELVVGSGSGFVASDMLVAHDGRIFVGGYDTTTKQAEVRIYNRRGEPAQGNLVVSSAPVSAAAPPVINYVEREVSEDEQTVKRREIAVGFGTTGNIDGEVNGGGVDLVTAVYYFNTAAPDAYEEVWQFQIGTAGDDRPRWVGIDRDGNVFITGETSGQWPGQSSAGGDDGFVQRIDTELDGSDRFPKLAWTRQTGSGADERVVGGSTVSNSATLFGDTGGAVEGEANLGGIDYFFYSASSATGNLTIHQRGTEGDDELMAGVNANGLIWLLGNSRGAYRTRSVENDDGTEDTVLEREPLDSLAGFLVGYSTLGDINHAVSLNDPEDVSEELFEAVLGFDGEVVVAGRSNGDFKASAGNGAMLPQPVLARAGLRIEEVEGEEAEDEEGEDGEGPEEQERLTLLWREQLPLDNASIQALSHYRDDEITALFNVEIMGERVWSILVFSGEGRLLN